MSPRVGLYLCRWNDKFYPAVDVGAATTDDGSRSSTVCACCSPKQRTHNLTTGVYEGMIEMLTDLVARQGCNAKLEGGGGVEF